MRRVTHDMISQQVVFNLSRSLNRFYKLQNEMSTNRRINKPSDDPLGTMKDLIYRERLSNITQYKSNISIGKVWLSTSESALTDVNNAISSAYELAVAMSNDTYDAVAREAAANEVESLLEQVMGAANSELHGGYLFSGYRTETQTIVKGAMGAVYQGDDGRIDYRIDTNATVQVNMIGSDLFTRPFQVLGADTDLKAGITATTPLTSLNGGSGIDLTTGSFTITDANLSITANIDLNVPAPPTTVGEVLTAINNQLAAAGITNVTASVGLEGNNIRLVATDNPTITVDTPLANLNSGTGIDLEPGQFLIRSADDSIHQTIDISGAATVGDVITAIQTQLGVAGVTVGLNGTGTGLEITDTNLPPLDLLVEETTATEFTAANLGILGAINPTLTGLDLNPQSEFVVAENGGTTAADLGILAPMSESLIGSDLQALLLPTTELSSLDNGGGLPLGRISIAQGDAQVTIDTSDPTIVTVQDFIDAINNSGLLVTASVNADQSGIQIVNDDPTRTLIIRNLDDSRTATRMGLVGSADVVGNLMLLAESLHDNDREVVEKLVGSLDLALNTVLTQRGSAGAKLMRLEVTLNRLEEHQVNYTRLLSEVEDADLTQVLTDLAMQENAYTAALTAAAKIIQPSLLNFIE